MPPRAARRRRPFLEALFADGVYALSRVTGAPTRARGPPRGRRRRRHARVWTVPEYFRDVGFAAFGVRPDRRRRGLLAGRRERSTVGVLHLRREDREGTLRAHRTLRNASVLEAAFRRAGFGVDHCCDFRAPDATRRAIQKVSRADVVVGMHGAAFAHLTWHKPGAVVVELFSHKMAGLWFYRSHTRRYGSVFVGPAKGRDAAYWRGRLDMDAATADRVVRCAQETAAGADPKPACDAKPPK